MALEFVSTKSWTLPEFDAYWWQWIQTYKGYINFATKSIVRARRDGRTGPDVLGASPSEDMFAVCRLPALLYAYQRQGYAERDKESEVNLSPTDCWSGEFRGILEPQPLRVSRPFKSEGEAKEYCELLGVHICGGISCWSTHRTSACSIALPGAKTIVSSGAIKDGDMASSWTLQHCPATTGMRHFMRAAVESASVQYATTATFATAAYLAAVAWRLTVYGIDAKHGGSRADLEPILREATLYLVPHHARFIDTVLDAVGLKLDEVEKHGASWSSDPVEVDDIALRTFQYSQDGMPEFEHYPCRSANCTYWQDSGKASPTVPALTSVLYLFLRHAEQPIEHTLAVNALLGGDNAARAVPLGMLIGSVQGFNAIPSALLHQLRARSQVASWLQKF